MRTYENKLGLADLGSCIVDNLMSLPFELHMFAWTFGWTLYGLATVLFVIAAAVLDQWIKPRLARKRTGKKKGVRSKRPISPLEKVKKELVDWLQTKFDNLIYPKKSAPLKWAGVDEPITVGSYRIDRPLTYYSELASSELEASCIDLSLEIGRPTSKAGLMQEPRYAGFSPAQRASYNLWMSTGRVAALHDTRYAHLFFYGLERRALIERKDHHLILPEVVRLIQTYDFRDSLDQYLARFLSFVIAREHINAPLEQWIKPILDLERVDKDGTLLSVGLSQLSRRKEPLPFHWAIRLASLDPRSPRSVVLTRSWDEFVKLFINRYQEKFGSGMILKAAEQDAKLTYIPANPLLRMQLKNDVFEPVSIADVLSVSSQFDPLIDIWTSAIEDLKPLSRARGKSGGEVLDRASFEALPIELKEGLEHPDKANWEKLLAEVPSEQGLKLVHVRDLAGLLEIEDRKKLTAKQSESIASTAQAVGYAIEPDPFIKPRLYGWHDLVALFPLEKSDKPPAPDSNYQAASLMLELGVYIAASDGTVAQDELDHITYALEAQFALNPSESRRLEALKSILVRQPRSLVGLGRALVSHLETNDREALGSFLIGIATLHGPVQETGIAALRTSFKALDLVNETLERLLKARSTSAENAKPQLSQGTVTLDEELLGRIVLETREVSRRLAEVMDEVEPEADTDPEPPAPVTPAKSAAPEPDGRFPGLDLRYHQAVAELVAKSAWPRAEFEKVVKKMGLMPSATLDIVNEWAMETFNDPLIEERDEMIVIHSQLVLN